MLAGVDLAEISITSGIRVMEGPVPEGAFTLADVPGVGVVSALAEGEKCERCWQVLPEVGTTPSIRPCATAAPMRSITWLRPLNER